MVPQEPAIVQDQLHHRGFRPCVVPICRLYLVTSDYDMLNPHITATLARVSDRRGLRYCERRPVAV
jgi:hypothetical protein